MANPFSLTNGQNMVVDTPADAAGVGHLKLSVGDVEVAGTTDPAGWQGVATHTDGATPAAGDGVVLVAGYYPTGDAVIKLKVDASGALVVGGGGGLENGSKVTGVTTAVAISSASVPCSGALVKAYSDNAETIYVGKSDVTADKTAATGGYPLEPGESVGVPCRNANEVYIRGAATDGVAWLVSAD